jgi:hypothetical protein
MLRTLSLPDRFHVSAARGKPVIVIAPARDGRTLISNSAYEIYRCNLHLKLHADWICGVGESAAMIFEALSRDLKLINDETWPFGFFTTTPIDQVHARANYVCDALRAINEPQP